MNLVQIESLNFKKCLGIVNTASQNLCFNDKQRENPPPSESICWQAHLRWPPTSKDISQNKKILLQCIEVNAALIYIDEVLRKDFFDAFVIKVSLIQTPCLFCNKFYGFKRQGVNISSDVLRSYFQIR